MNTFGKSLVLICLFTGFGSGMAADSPTGPIWPLGLGTRYLTSNFMEYRNGRFHAGLDLKTQSREGFVVRAVEDGYISRLRCTPSAYGRVVYLQGVSGRTYVFAHLHRFNDDLRARVERVQNQNGTYRARLEFNAGAVPVFQGQVLGLSGQSGTGGPHLHFEVRDSNQRPLNPLDHGFAVEDRLPPVIHTLRAWPASSNSTVNGSVAEHVISTQKTLGLTGDIGVLEVTGAVAFSARMIDASDIREHKLEPYRIEVELAGEIVYRCRNDVYSFGQNSLQRLEWTDWAHQSIPREHWLHRRSANSLHGREGSLWYLGDHGDGLGVGDHDLVLRVRDHAGGQSSVRWILRVSAESTGAQSASWIKQPMGFAPADSNGLRLTPFFSAGDPHQAGYIVLEFSPENGDPVLEPLELWVKFEDTQSSFFDLARSQGLEPVGRAARFVAVDWPIESSLHVALPNGELFQNLQGDKLGVYRLHKQKRWDLVRPIASSGAREFLLEEPGLHCVFRDSIQPVFQSAAKVLQVRIGEDSPSAEVTFPRWEITAIDLVDHGSGVDSGTIAVELDGARLIVEPDPPRDRILVEWPDNMAAGHHTLHIVASDKAGNSAHINYNIQATEEAP